MAPQTRIEEKVPTTLPDDFGEWDSGAGAAPPTTLPDDFEGFDSGPDVLESPAPKAVALPPAAIREPEFAAVRTPAVKAAPAVKQAPAVKPAPVSRKPERVATPAPTASYAKAEVIPPARTISQAKSEPESTDTGKSKKTMMMAGIGATVLLIVLLAVLIPMMRSKPVAKSNVVAVSQPVVTQPGTEAPLDQPAAKPAAATPLQQTTSATSASAAAATPAQTTPAPVQSDLMDKQLNAPSRISLKNQGQEAAPSTNFAAGGLEGLGGSGVGVGAGMGSHSAPNVKFAQPKFVTISSGVAQGMLVSRTTPNYPAIAKTARVAGTVVLEATISKTGTIESVKAVSGPEMLRQAAVDAVRSWRYKPYMLDNQPIEMQTTVNVVFSLGGS